MSDLELNIPTWRRNLRKKLERERRQRRQRKVAIMVVIASVVGLVAIAGAMQFGWFAQDDPAMATYDRTKTHYTYTEPQSDCPDGTVEYIISMDEGTECVSREEDNRRQEQKLAEVNSPIYGAMDNLQARFDAEPELSGKLSVILTTFCQSGVKYQILRDYLSPDMYSPDWYDLYPEPVFSYNPSRPLGTFGSMAASLWEANWNAEAAGWLPANFINAAATGCGTSGGYR